MVERARRGVGVSQARGAALLGLSRATLNNYERRRVTPSERKMWELLAGLARGESVAGDRPLLLVSFALCGQRFASWRGQLLAFRELDHAQRLLSELDDCDLEPVLVLPAWPSAVAEAVAKNGRIGWSVFEDSGVSLDDLVSEVFSELAADGRRWVAERFTGGRKGGVGEYEGV